jgi:hypothetical protein
MNGSQLQLILESRIDYATITAKEGKRADILEARGRYWAATEATNGYTVTPWAWKGYLGETTNGVTWGRRTDDVIIRLSGKAAERYAPTAITYCDNVSRLDVQVTLQDQGMTVNWAERVYDIANTDSRVVGKQTKTSLIANKPSGATCYIGSRSSERYYRCYDKHAESDGTYPPGTWRYEVEYKAARALAVARRLQDQGFTPRSSAEVVQQAFANYGFNVPALLPETSWRDAGIKYQTTDERRLLYLSTSIAPMIDRLRETYALTTIQSALGLPDIETGEVVPFSAGMVQAVDPPRSERLEEWRYNKATPRPGPAE